MKDIYDKVGKFLRDSKKYGDLESSKFVNGILDKIHKQEIVADAEKADSP